MVIADTDIIIASIRGNVIAHQLLRKYAPHVSLSIITVMELFVGANNPTKKEIVFKVLNTHAVIPLSKQIGLEALRLIKEYNTITRSLHLPDALIAATCVSEGVSLITFNTQDYSFIKGLQLAG